MSGTDFYTAHAASLAARYDAIDAARLHGPWTPLLDARSAGLACDVGAGSGRDACWLALRGWKLVAVEPSAAMRRHGERASTGLPIVWLDDKLPHLARLRERAQGFDLILLQAVWQHLDAAEREIAIDTLARLLVPGGLVVVSLRMGRDETENRERGFHAVSAQELLALGAAHGLAAAHHSHRADLTRGDLSWETLVLEAPGPARA